MKVRAKTFRNDFRIEATADEVDVSSLVSFFKLGIVVWVSC